MCLTCCRQSRPGDVESSLKTNSWNLCERIHQQRKVASNIVHQEEESPNTDGSDASRDNLDQDSEQEGKPGLS